MFRPCTGLGKPAKIEVDLVIPLSGVTNASPDGMGSPLSSPSRHPPRHAFSDRRRRIAERGAGCPSMTESHPHREEILSALVVWRDELARVLQDRLGPAPSVREMASRLGIGRGAAHAISRILFARNGTQIGAEIPGLKNRQLLLARLFDLDADHVRLQRLATAQDHLESLLKRHAPSKVALIAALADPSSGEQVQSSLLEGLRRRFDCDAILFGASVEHLLAAQIFAPTPRGDLLNLVGIQLLNGVRQWRSNAEVELHRPFSGRWQGHGLSEDQSTPVVSDASDPNWADQIEDTAFREHHRAYVLRPRAVLPSESRSALRIGFGEYVEAIGAMERKEPGETGEMGCPLIVPTRMLVLECWLHRDVRRGGGLEATVYHDFRPGLLSAPERRRMRIPIPTTLTTIKSGWSPPGEIGDKDAIEAYRLLASRGVERLGSTIDDYEIHRLLMPWPPTGGLVNITWPLAPASARA